MDTKFSEIERNLRISQNEHQFLATYEKLIVSLEQNFESCFHFMFYKKNTEGKAKSRKTPLCQHQYFWEQDFSNALIQKLFSSSKSKELIRFFFKPLSKFKENNKLSIQFRSAPKIITFLIENHPNEMMESIRVNEDYKKIEVIQSLKILKEHPDKKMRDFFDVIEYLQKIFSESLKMLESHKAIIHRMSIYKLLNHFTHFYLEQVFQLVKNGKEDRVRYLLESFSKVVSMILNEKMGEMNKTSKHPLKKSSDDFLKYCADDIVKRKNKPESFNKIKAAFFSYYNYVELQSDIFHYFSYDLNSEIEKKSDGTFHLIPKDHDINEKWWRDGLKYSPCEAYYYNQSELYLEEEKNQGRFIILGESEEDQRLNFDHHVRTLASLKRLEEYGIEGSIESTIGEVNLFNLFSTAYVMAASGKSRMLYPFMKECDNSENEDYIQVLTKVFISNAKVLKFPFPLRQDSYKDFVNRIMDNLRIDQEAAEKVLDYLCYDVGKDQYSINILETPFIRVYDKLYTITPVFSDTDFSVTMINRLLSSFKKDGNRQIRDSRMQSESFKMEVQLAERFKAHGFEAEAGLSLVEPGTTKNDMDVIAIKDNVIILLELKRTYVRSTLDESYLLMENSLKGAAKQLKDRISKLKDKKYFEVLKSQMNINFEFSDIEQGNVEIFPLIVSTSFEHDGIVLDKALGIKKVSLFEINAIFDNNLYFLHEGMPYWEEKLSQMIRPEEMTQAKKDGTWDMMLHEFIIEKIKQEEHIKAFNKSLRFYEGDEISSQDFMDSINKNKVWTYLEQKPYQRDDHYILLSSNPTYQEHTRYHEKAAELYEQKHYEEAFKYYDKALAIYQEDPDYFSGRGNCHAYLGNTKASIVDLSKAIELGGENLWSYYMNRGMSYSELDEKEKALIDLDKAIGINPNAPEIYVNRSNIWAKEENTEKFFEDLSKALEIDPKHPGALRLLSMNSMFDYFNSRKATDLNEDKLYERAFRHFIFNELDEAEKDYNQLLKMNPKDYHAVKGKADCYFKRNDFDKAEEYIKKAIDMKSDEAAFYDTYSKIHLAKGNHEQSLKYCDKTIKLGHLIKDSDYNMAIYYNNRGHLFMEMKLYHKALKDFEQGHEYNKLDPMIIGNLVQAHARLGNNETALFYQDKLEDINRKINPDNWDIPKI